MEGQHNCVKKQGDNLQIQSLLVLICLHKQTLPMTYLCQLLPLPTTNVSFIRRLRLVFQSETSLHSLSSPSTLSIVKELKHLMFCHHFDSEGDGEVRSNEDKFCMNYL